MFPFIGIHAEEEPRTEISPNGLYNSSDSSSLTASSLSQDLLSGRSEFTFMFWAYIDATSGTLITTPYIEYTAIGQSSITVAGTGFDYIFVSLKNTNGGTTSLTANVTVDYQDWFHVAVTGSVLNGRVRAYYNGVLIDSATMTYANAVATSNELNSMSSLISTAQYNVYDRELSETEVAEHIADDGSGVGALTYDAMDANQRQGLVYCSSFIKDISISGNEFTDKSGNGITLSTTPSLTGEQIYAYTDVGAVSAPNALPAGLPFSLGGTAPPVTIYPVDSANPTISSTQYVQSTSYDNTYLAGEFTWSVWVKITNDANPQSLLRSSSPTSDINLMYYWNSLDGNLVDKISFGFNTSGTWYYEGISIPSITDGNWHNLQVTVSVSGSTRTIKIYHNNSEVLSFDKTATPNTDVSSGLATAHNSGVENLRSPFDYYSIAHEVLDSTDRTNLYNNGQPTCFAEIPTVTKDKLENWWDLGLYNGSNEAQALADQIGSADFVNNGTTPFSDQGLQVEC